MKASTTMHLPKDHEQEHLPSLGALDFDLDDFLGSINEPPTSLKKDSLECPECSRRGEKFRIRPYQLNFHEAMYLCPNPTCSYPMKEDRLVENFTFKREASLAVEDDKRELYHHSSENLGDIFNCLNDPMEFTSEFEESGASSFNNSVPIANTSKTNIFDSETPNTLNPNACEYPLSLPIATQSQSTGSLEIDSDNQSAASNIDSSIHPQENKECIDTVPTISDVLVPEDLCSTTQSGTVSFDEPMNTVSEILDEEIPAKPITVHPTICFASSMIQWRNENNLCWLDSILQMAVASNNIRAALSASKSEGTANKVWANLINIYDQSQVTLNDSSFHDKAVSLDSISVNLNNARKNFLGELQNFFKQLEYGKFQSLVEMLPLSLKIDHRLENIFKTKLLWRFQCSNCNYQSARRSGGLIVSIPNTLDNFHPLNAKFKKRCQACKSQNAFTAVWMEQLPPCIVFHFQTGLSHPNLKVLDFALCGQLYCIFAVVQYITGDPKHFVTWIRDIKKDRWLRCDDLREPICQWTNYHPKIPHHEIHMVFWERRQSNGSNTLESALQAVRNEEVISLAESIPIEHFQAHEKETIVLSEDAGSSTAHNNTQNQVVDTSQTEVCERDACGVTADIETSTLMHTSGQNVTMHASTVHNTGQNGQHNASAQANPAVITLPTAGFPQTSLQPAPQLENGAMTMIPTDDGRQHIQIIAPPNACNIYIVSQNQQTGQPFYLIPASQKCSQSSYPTLPSFINNPHSYNMVAQGVSGPLQNQTEKPKGSLKRIRRQYKLSGYSKRTGPANRYTPMQASKSCSSIKSADSICDAASVKSCNSKGDSETRSELSELSDILPDFEASGYARDRV